MSIVIFFRFFFLHPHHKIIDANPPKAAHVEYTMGNQLGSLANNDPETNAPNPIPTSRDISMVPKPIAIFPSGDRSAVQAKIVGILIPTDKP